MLRESCWPMLCQWELLTGEFQVRQESLRLEFPFNDMWQSHSFQFLALLTLQVDPGPEKSSVIPSGEANTNGCIREVTLDFHTDRFSFFFFSFFNEISGEGEGRWVIEHYDRACNCLYSFLTYLVLTRV